MTQTVAAFRQYRVSKTPDTALIDPEFGELTSALAAPRDFSSIVSGSRLEFCGKALQDARNQARAEVVELAQKHTRQYADLSDCTAQESSQQPIILSGHQPELFHAGVWFKNFLISSMAKETGAVAINFLVDNDLCRDTAVRVPTTEAGKIITEQVRYDSWRDAIPWELRSIQDRSIFEQFPDAVQKSMAGVGGFRPLVHDLWPAAQESLSRTGKIGWALAEARHRLELEEGLCTLEVPLSQLVSTRAFARFSIQLMSELPRFQQIYNEERDVYRKAHKIRNEAHPVPKLEQRDGWIEGPWWVYRPESPTRQKLWVRMHDDQLILSDRAGWQEVIEGRLDCDNAASQWLDILAEGVRLRPRALLTTMYLRMFVGDLFVHGIGGGKYDQLTDNILSQYFGIEPPVLGVATATMHLPLESASFAGTATETEELIRLKRDELWRGKFNADQSSVQGLSERDETELAELNARKAELLSNIPERGDKWEWHQQMKKLSLRMRELTSSHSETLKQEIDDLGIQLKQQQLLESREYSFCLFPREQIFSTLKKLARPS